MPNNPADARAERLAALERHHAELMASLPAHSIPASLLLRIEAVEDEIGALRAELQRERSEEGTNDAAAKTARL